MLFGNVSIAERIVLLPSMGCSSATSGPRLWIVENKILQCVKNFWVRGKKRIISIQGKKKKKKNYRWRLTWRFCKKELLRIPIRDRRGFQCCKRSSERTGAARSAASTSQEIGKLDSISDPHCRESCRGSWTLPPAIRIPEPVYPKHPSFRSCAFNQNEISYSKQFRTSLVPSLTQLPVDVSGRRNSSIREARSGRPSFSTRERCRSEKKDTIFQYIHIFVNRKFLWRYFRSKQIPFYKLFSKKSIQRLK